MSDTEEVELSSRCPSPCNGESESDGSNAEIAECNPKDREQPESENPNGSSSWCLIDHPEIWMKPNLFIPKEGEGEEEELKDVILRSERLQALMNKPRNEITSLPDAKTIADHFSCAICHEIPFPWKGDPDILMDEEENLPFPETVYLCEQGHVVCRACAQSFDTCSFSEPDIDITQNEEEEDSDSDTDQYQPGTLEDEDDPMSMDSWGLNPLCLAPIDISSHDIFLAKLIEDSEFACQYYYNWCSFRGKGKALQNHEKICKFKESPSKPKAKCSGQSTEKECEKPQTQNKENSDDDDSAILSLDLSDAASKANDLIGEILAEHLFNVDLSYISPHVLRNHIAGWDEQDGGADAQCIPENNLNEVLQPKIGHQEKNGSDSDSGSR